MLPDGLLGVAEEGAGLRADEVEAPLEEALHAGDVAVEVHLGVDVVHGDHLREVDEDGGDFDLSFGARLGVVWW